MGLKRTAADRVAATLALALRAGGQVFYRHVLDTLWSRHPFDEEEVAPWHLSLHVPEPVQPDPVERPLVERILLSYRRAKSVQLRADPVFLPARAWQGVLETAYSALSAGSGRDVDRAHQFLANFRSWPETTGMEPSQQLRAYARNARQREHYERQVVAPILRWWARAESAGRDLSALTTPAAGNPAGVVANGHLISPAAVFCDVYARLIVGWLRGERPVLAEIGGGFGKLCSFVVRHRPGIRYVGFDLPESLACAAYFLALAFPGRRTLLYGEGDLNEDALDQYDTILMPSFEIARLPDRSVDLFVNENSLGLMAADTCRHLVKEMCRTADAVFHRNREAVRTEFEDGTSSLLNGEYPVPPEAFELIVRYCDVGRIMSSGRLNFDADMFWYLYSRRATSASDGDRRRAGTVSGS